MRRISEAETRKELNVPSFIGGIDPQLEREGWYLANHAKVKIEILTVEPARRVCGRGGAGRVVAPFVSLRGSSTGRMGESTQHHATMRRGRCGGNCLSPCWRRVFVKRPDRFSRSLARLASLSAHELRWTLRHDETCQV